MTALFKSVGSKLVKNDRLQLFERKNSAIEMKCALQRFEQVQYSILMEYLFWFSHKNVVTTRESGSCLLDTACLQSTTNNRREKVDACLN